MKKVFLTLSLCLAFITMSAQSFTWEQVVDIFEESIDEIGGDIEDQMGAMGIDLDIDTDYNKATKTFEIYFDFDMPEIVNAMDKNMLNQFRDVFVSSFISSAMDDPATLKSLLNAMDKANGKLKIIFQAKSGAKLIQKDVVVTAKDLKSFATKNYGVKF